MPAFVGVRGIWLIRTFHISCYGPRFARDRNMKPSKHLAALAMLLTLAGCPVGASAFQPLITDDAGTQGRGGNQFEFALRQDRAVAADKVERLRSLPVVYTRGLSETLDVFASLGHARIRSNTPGRDTSGAGNSSFGVKWRFHENERTGTSYALRPEVLLPVSADFERAGLGTREISGGLTLIFSQAVAFGSIHVNAGVGHDGYREASNHPDTTRTRASVACAWDLSAQWMLVFDLGTETARAAETRVRANFVELGAVYSPDKDLNFALGILHSSDNDSPRSTKRSANAGVTWRFR